MKAFGLMTILVLSSSEAFAANHHRKGGAIKHCIGRGGFTKQSKKPSSWFTPRMVISSSQLARKVCGIRSQSTRVKYANEDDVLLLPPRRKSPGGILLPVKMEETRIRVSNKQPSIIKTLDVAIFFTYLCSSLVMNLPILLLPMAAAEHAAGTTSDVSALVVSITSIAIMGGGLGKLVNGFVCQEFGGKKSSAFYLLGGAVSSLLFSMALPQTTLGWAYAGIEFFVSMQWTALSVILAQHYQDDDASFASGITCLSMASTAGQLLAKFAGMTLLQYMHWRSVAQLGAIMALIGSCIVHVFVKEPSETRIKTPKPTFRWTSIQSSASKVLSNPLFWVVGYAHAMSMVAKSSDRILGEFFSHATSLPRSICGGLTLSVTIGLVHGLFSGRRFQGIKDASLKQSFIARRYVGAVLSALALAVAADPTVSSLIHSKYVMAGLLTLLSACMTSCMAFQFFQLPSMVAQTFEEEKAVAISWMDATAFFLSAPIWTTVGHLVVTQGWSAAFVLIAALFGVGGIAMSKVMTPVLKQ